MADPTVPDTGSKLGAWNELIRRARIGRERKLVCLTFSSYGNAQGRRIFCGVARLAVDCEMGYSTARRYLAWIRNVGLAEVVKRGSRRKGLSDEYRLTFGPDILEHLDVPDPDSYKAMIDGLSETNRVATVKRQARRGSSVDSGSVLRSPADVAEAAAGGEDELGTDPPDQPSQGSTAALDVGSDMPERLPVQRSPMASVKDDGEDAADHESFTLTQTERKTEFLRSPEAVFTLTQGERPPSIDHLTKRTTFHLDRVNLRTDLEVPCARAPEEEQISSEEPADDPAPTPAAGKCPEHPYMAGGHRADGTLACAFCRRAATTTQSTSEPQGDAA